MKATLIAAIIVAIIAVLSGGILIVNLSEPLASLKDMFIALIDLICDNAILFAVFLLVFVIAFSLISKAKITPIDISGNKQQKIDNKFRQQKFEAEQRQLDIDNKFREKRLKDYRKQQNMNQNKGTKQEFMQHSYTKKQLNSLYDNDNLDNIKLTRK